jgi:hypothetical protein
MAIKHDIHMQGISIINRTGHGMTLDCFSGCLRMCDVRANNKLDSVHVLKKKKTGSRDVWFFCALPAGFSSRSSSGSFLMIIPLAKIFAAGSVPGI